MAFAFMGCSRTRFVSVRYLPEKSLEFFVPLCGDEKLRELQLKEVADVKDPSRDRLIWSLQAIGNGARVARLEFGSEPTGFRSGGLASLSELIERYSHRTLTVYASTDRR